MLQPKYKNDQDNCNKKFFTNRYEKIVQQYEDPIKSKKNIGVVNKFYELQIQK
ncbi:MAG: hypothetical protein N3F66_09680 [Spirochaetes bacterium]|nr:hypothetical protein [Spirochaetota bacterium]